LSEAKALAGRRALVTGAARRLGREIALQLAAAGADVCITYQGSADEAAETVELLHAAGARALAVQCDVREPAQVAAAVQSAVDALGGLEILVNNAAVFLTAKLEEITAEAFDEAMRVNARGPLLMAQAAYPHLKRAKGRIVNIGSLGGEAAWATHGHYNASKAALHMLTQAMAKAWAPEVAVNCVAPGVIVMDGRGVGGDFAEVAQRSPMGRAATAAEVASAVLYFASAPLVVTGQVLKVDGGLGL
jgi:3-oxoacyl-[acyl-carrier protein] reductase/pteridine reductase